MKSFAQTSSVMSWALTVLCFLNSFDACATTITDRFNAEGTYVVIKRYEIQKDSKERIGKALNDYVRNALADEGNILAEVFQEEGQPLVLWLLERWGSKDHYSKFSQSPQVKELLTLSKSELVQPVKVYYLNELAPLSKTEWRKAPA